MARPRACQTSPGAEGGGGDPDSGPGGTHHPLPTPMHALDPLLTPGGITYSPNSILIVLMAAVEDPSEGSGLSRAVKVHRTPEGWRCGETHHNAKHSDAEVNRVRDLHDSGLGWRKISRKLGLPPAWVREICLYRRRPFVREMPTFQGGTA